MLKRILCTIIALALLCVPTFALATEDIYKNLDDELDYLNRFVGCSGPIHNPNDHIVIEECGSFSPNTKFTSYSQVKGELLEFCSPYLAMVALSGYQHINVNGKIYTYDEFLAPFTEGGMPFYNTVEIISSSENSTLFNFSYIVDGESLLSGIGEYVKIDGEWKLDAVDGIIGQTSQNRAPEDVKTVFASYAAKVIRSYIVSENKSCGYGKYLSEPSDSNSNELVIGDILDVSVTEFNEADCTGSAYILINEYDKNQNIVATRTITVEIGENLTEKVSTDAPANENPNTSDFTTLYVLSAIVAISGIGMISNRKKA